MKSFLSILTALGKFRVFLFLLLTVSPGLAQNLTTNGISKSEPAFIRNEGQVIDQTGRPNRQVLYLLNSRGLNVQLKKNGFSYDTYEFEEHPLSQVVSNDILSKRKRGMAEDKIARRIFHRVDIQFVNSNPEVEIKEIGETASFFNFYNVPGIERGITGVKSFKRLYYKDLYPGIDVDFFIPEDPAKPVEYNFIVHPHGDIGDIRMQISGANVTCTPGSLELDLIHGKLSEVIPASWSGQGKNKTPVLVNFVQQEENIFGFDYADRNQKKENTTLTIDPTPVRQWATYYGGEENESYFVGDVATDSRGNSVIVGYTQSSNILGTGGPPESAYEGQVFSFLAKFDPTGKLLWTTYYGGALGARLTRVTVDKDNHIIGVGDSASPENIATPGTHQTSLYEGNPENYGDGIIVKFDSNGNRIWGTYFGGESFDGLTGVTTDHQGNIYAIGTTASHENISTPGSFKEIGDADVHHKWNGILAKFDKNGNRIWATFYAGEETNEVAVDKEGNIYFVGSTYSNDEISTPGAHRKNILGTSWNEAFIAKFTPSGERIWGTYFGGYDYDFGEGLAIDSENNVIISGATRSAEHIATPGAHKEKKATSTDWDTFLAKFNSSGKLLWSTFYGGDETESHYFNRVDVDINDNIFLFGSTGSNSGISTPDGFQPAMLDGPDVFLTKFTQNGERIWGTYYGGNSSDFALSLDITDQGDIFLIGWTYSSIGISTPGAHQVVHGGKIDAFLVKFKDCLSGISAEAPAGVCEGEDVSFKASGGTSYLWTGPNGFLSTIAAPVIPAAQPSASGTYYVSISSGTGCDETLEFEVTVSPAPVAYPADDLSACEEEPGTGIASFDLSEIEIKVMGNQSALEISFFDEAGNNLPSPLPALYKNSIPNKEKLTVRVSERNNPSCFAETTFELLVHPLPQITATGELHACDDDLDGLSSFDVGHLENEIINNQQGLEVKFYDSSGGELDFSGTYQNTKAGSQSILAKVINKNSGCSTNFRFNLVVSPDPVAHPLNDITGCDDNGDGFSEYFDVTGVAAEVLAGQSDLEISYFNSDGEKIQDFTSPYSNSKAYEEIITVRLTNPRSGCSADTQLRLKTSAAPHVNGPAILYSCDEGNGIGSFDTADWVHEIIGNQTGLKLSWYDGRGNALPTPLPAVYRNSISHSETLTVKVENEQNIRCFSESQLKLVVNPKPLVGLEESYSICDLQPFLKLNLSETFDKWEWRYQDESVISTTSQVLLKQEGTYSLTVGALENGLLCEETRSFSLKRSIVPEIKEVNVRDWSSRNFIEVIAEGEGDFEYSIDGLNFTDSNYFGNLGGGIYMVYVRDKNGCGMDSREVILIDYPKFFTPNGDGYNDLWQLKGASTLPEAHVEIFDRYGNLLKQMSSHDTGWDGNYNGRAMPSDDYWFSTSLEGRTFKTHFTLKR